MLLNKIKLNPKNLSKNKVCYTIPKEEEKTQPSSYLQLVSILVYNVPFPLLLEFHFKTFN